MSDFILTTSNTSKDKLRKAMKLIYDGNNIDLNIYSGDWGTLAINKNIYNGFEPYENDCYLTIVIGGPLLMYTNNNFILNENSNDGTKSIFERWQKGKLNPDKDLNGPYSVVIVDKKNKNHLIITDIMSFIPIYKFQSANDLSIASHVDVLAQICNQTQSIDEVSVVDFILNGFITYPHTLYSGIEQIQPASYHEVIRQKLELTSVSYWEPMEEQININVDSAASTVRQSLENYVGKITEITSNIAQFISGGEDSRTLAGLLQNYNRTGYIYIDSLNREGKIANKIANIYSAKFEYRKRTKDHYLNILPKSAKLVGTGSEYHHAHTYGFHKELRNYDAVFGGLLADALLKGSHIERKYIIKKLPFLLDIKNDEKSRIDVTKTNEFPENLVNEVTKRRELHLNYIQKFRSDESANEWFELWPSSMNRNIPNIHANRRLFKSYEPFMCNEIVKISASVPQEWKLNRKLFHKSVQEYLKQSKWVFHGDGWLPYFSKKVNIPIRFITWTSRQVKRRMGLMKEHQGPWTEWKTLISTQEWNDTIKKYDSNCSSFSEGLQSSISSQIEKNTLTTLQYVALTQVLYQLQKREDNEV